MKNNFKLFFAHPCLECYKFGQLSNISVKRQNFKHVFDRNSNNFCLGFQLKFLKSFLLKPRGAKLTSPQSVRDFLRRTRETSKVASKYPDFKIYNVRIWAYFGLFRGVRISRALVIISYVVYGVGHRRTNGICGVYRLHRNTVQ